MQPDQVDVDSLPPTQYLLLDVLAARYRLGEEFWAFPTSVQGQLGALGRAGLVQVDRGTEPRTVRASLTDLGRRLVVTETYETPRERALRAELDEMDRWSQVGHAALEQARARLAGAGEVKAVAAEAVELLLRISFWGLHPSRMDDALAAGRKLHDRLKALTVGGQDG